MSEYTIDGTSHDINEVIRYLDGDHHMGVHDRARVVAELRAQLPKPVPEEPTGDSLMHVWGVVYKRQDNGSWWTVGTVGAGYEWPDLIAECHRTGSDLPVIYDRRAATPPTEEVAEPAKHKQSCEWPECPGNEDCEGLSLLSEVTMGITLPAEADPLEALYAELKEEWELDAGDWVILRNFVERVRALTTEDTGELVKAAGRLIDMWDSSPSTVKRITTDYPGLDHAIDLVRRNLPDAD